MTNVTIILDDDTATRAKVLAAQRGMSLSRYVGEILRREFRNGDVYDAAYRSWKAATLFPLGGPQQEYPKRDEVNDRPLLRRD